MTTHNTHYDSDLIMPSSSDTVDSSSSLAHAANDVDAQASESSTATLALAYMLSLAALAVVAITGQFPWFMVTLAGGAAIASAVPTRRIMQSTRSRRGVISA